MPSAERYVIGLFWVIYGVSLVGDIFNEVDEEVRQEQVSRLWNRYGRYFLASLAIIVLGTAGHAAWDYFGTQRSLADGGRFSNAIELFQLEQHQEASKLFSELTADAGHGYGQLAQLQKLSELEHFPGEMSIIGF